MKTLTVEEVKQKCPLAFLTEPTANVSSKYSFANTAVVMEDLGELGWQPVKTGMRKSRKPQYSKHMIVFQNPDMVISGEKGDDVFPQIILNNSHDGTSSFQFRVGLYRLVCSNGLVVATAEFSSLKIRHMHYSFDALRDVVRQSVETLPRNIEIMNDMRSVELTASDQRDFALDALLLRHGIELSDRNEGKALVAPSTIQDLLAVNRSQDKGDDLWRTFNRVQENIVRGNYVYLATKGKERKATPIRSFLTDQDVNQRLFQRATELVPA